MSGMQQDSMQMKNKTSKISHLQTYFKSKSQKYTDYSEQNPNSILETRSLTRHYLFGRDHALKVSHALKVHAIHLQLTSSIKS